MSNKIKFEYINTGIESPKLNNILIFLSKVSITYIKLGKFQQHKEKSVNYRHEPKILFVLEILKKINFRWKKDHFVHQTTNRQIKKCFFWKKIFPQFFRKETGSQIIEGGYMFGFFHFQNLPPPPPQKKKKKNK